MSDQSKNTVNTSSSSGAIKSNNDLKDYNPSHHSAKRPGTEDVGAEIKKMKIETLILEQSSSMVPNAPMPNFVRAAAMVASSVEISDEELLEWTLQFEREHGI